MYNMGDTTYKNQPKFMSVEIIRELGKKIKTHCITNNTKNISIVFHGGEPLLAEKDFYRVAISILRSELTGIDVDFQLQSNGTLLDEEWIELFNELGIQVGISIDGPESFQNEYRVYHNNKGSFDDVMKGIRIRDKHSVGGLISVINVDIPPKELYNFFVSIDSKRVNLLLPDNHYDQLPKGKQGNRLISDTKYGDWLIRIYDIWCNDLSLKRPSIPFFENIMSMILGSVKGDELIGKKKNGAITIETNGDIEVVDPLRICGNGFTRDRLNIVSHEISSIEDLPLFQEYYHSHERLCHKCDKCPIQHICGGGYLGHRFSSKSRFDNPSIYCSDLMKLITHIQNDIVSRLPENILEEIGLEPILFEEVYNSTI
jgi:uncharacterized protein